MPAGAIRSAGPLIGSSYGLLTRNDPLNLHSLGVCNYAGIVLELSFEPLS